MDFPLMLTQWTVMTVIPVSSQLAGLCKYVASKGLFPCLIAGDVYLARVAYTMGRLRAVS